MAEFKPTELEQVAYVFDKIVTAKKWEDGAALFGSIASLGDGLHKAFHAAEKYIGDKEKDKDFSPLSKDMITIGIAGGAAAKAIQDFCKFMAATKSPSKAESDLASKFMPSKDGDYEKIVELLTTKNNQTLVSKAISLFNKISDGQEKIRNAYDKILQQADRIQSDMDAADEIKKKNDGKVREASPHISTYTESKKTYDEIQKIISDSKRELTSDEIKKQKEATTNIIKAYRDCQKLSIDISECANDINDIADAKDRRTNGKALYEANKTAFTAIKEAWVFVIEQLGDDFPEAKERAEKAISAADSNAFNTETACDKEPSEIDWKNASVYYGNAHILAQVALSDFNEVLKNDKIKGNTTEKEELIVKKTDLEQAKNKNKLNP